jgi:CheY-like chemotaxis protein
MMGGDVEVASEPGKGSTFTVRLPVSAPQQEEAEQPELVGEGGDGHAGTVLVIDDDPAVRDLMVRFLGKEGFRVLPAADGEAGLALARDARPDVITLDVMMPGMDGWGVLTTLKADPALAEIPVVMLSVVDDKNMGFSLGASEYLTKPIDRSRLTAILAKYGRDGHQGSVLVVEDDGATRSMLKRSLEGSGWHVTEASNGRVALERVAEGCPDLVLLDLMMPEMDGFEFLEEFRGSAGCQAVPVVVLTAMELTEQDRRRLNGGVERIVEKGTYGREQLLAEVRQLVAAHSAGVRP